jgi:hypothetical protein
MITRVEYLDTLTREPMLVQAKSGDLFVAGYNRVRPGLWKSGDVGSSWSRVNVGSRDAGATGNSDVDLTIAPDGTLYFANLTFDGTVGEGRSVSMGVSHDMGMTWHWSMLSQVRFDDRPWVRVTPNGTAHVVWSDDHGVSHARSIDGGLTWIRTGRISDRGGSSHMTVGPHGEIAVQISPGAAGGNKCDAGTDIVAVSTDDGTTWQKHPAAGSPRQSGCEEVPGFIPRWVDPIAWTRNGLNALWTDSIGVRLSVSHDLGETWTTSTIVSRQPGDPTAYFPYLTAADRGELAATWFTGIGDNLRWHVALIDATGPGDPRVQQSAAMPLESRRGEPARADTGGEYIPVKFLNDRTIAVVSPIQNAQAGRLGFVFWRFGR